MAAINVQFDIGWMGKINPKKVCQYDAKCTNVTVCNSAKYPDIYLIRDPYHSSWPWIGSM